MDVDPVVHDPRGVPEPLHCEEPVPLGGLGVVDLEVDLVGDLLRAAAEHDHEGVAEERGVLLAAERVLGHVGVLLGRLDPVPLAVAVSAQPPGVVERRGVGPAPAEDHHHAVRAPGVADGRAVLDALAGALLGAVEARPGEGRALDVEAPDVVDGLAAGVAAEDQQVRLRVDHHVPLPAAGRRADDRHDHPAGVLVAVPQVEQLQVVRGQRAAARRAALDHHLQQFQRAGGVCCARRRRHSHRF